MGLIIVNHNMTKEKDFIAGEEICNREQERETSREILKFSTDGDHYHGWLAESK